MAQHFFTGLVHINAVVSRTLIISVEEVVESVSKKEAFPKNVRGGQENMPSIFSTPRIPFNGNNHSISEVLKHFLSFSNSDNSFTQQMAE
jgi:hypothetical protein